MTCQHAPVEIKETLEELQRLAANTIARGGASAGDIAAAGAISIRIAQMTIFRKALGVKQAKIAPRP